MTSVTEPGRRSCHFARFVAFVMLALGIATAKASPSFLGPENPGAENGPATWSWQSKGAGAFLVGMEDPAMGSKHFCLSNSVTGEQNQNCADFRAEKFTLKRPGKATEPLTFSFSYKLPAKVKPTDNIALSLRFFDKTGEFISQKAFSLGAQTGDSEMLRYKTMTATNIFAPSNAVTADIWVTANIFAPWTSGTAQFDDFAVKSVAAKSWAGVLVGAWICIALTTLLIPVFYLHQSQKQQ